MVVAHWRIKAISYLNIYFRVSTMPFYAVGNGRIPGIYKTWDECQRQVKGFPKAKYKKFGSEEEAREFIAQTSLTISPSSSSSSLGIKNTTKFKAKSEFSDMGNISKQSKLIPIEATMKHQFIQRSTFPSSPVVYTDGCCLGNGTHQAVGGVGVYWGPQHPRNVSEYLDVDKPTNQKAELRAAIRALENAIEMDLPSVELRTDSKYTIKSMTEWIANWEKNGWRSSKGTSVENKDEIFRLSELCKQISVTWVHTPGHVGIYGNEQADKLANDGALGRGT